MLMEHVSDRDKKKTDRWFKEPGERSLAWLLITPAYLLIFGLLLFPVLYALWVSFHQYTLLNPAIRFVGLDNYKEMLLNSPFWLSFGRTVYFTAVSIGIQLVLGLAMALVLNQKFVGQRLVRSLLLIPWAIPNIVNGVLWEWIYNANYGALNGVLKQFGIIKENILWLGKPFLALNMIILADTWKVIPFYVILILAGLQTISKDTLEAAIIDGAGGWKSFLYITLPLLKPILLVILVLRTMQCFAVFDIIYIMTKGGPADGTTLVSFFTYRQTFGSLNFGQGSATAYIVAMMVFAVSLLYLRMLKSDEA
ncbi:Carbohydrate ABC transporter membrane protein 1, CUT1 family [[Clostridium] ultunense Esp]|nr:Carbohydrate ABC transporter membrane protein 1, CUT1 family [[Clostridium] ultunense Esp]